MDTPSKVPAQLPACFHHKASDQAAIKIGGRFHYLGKWGSPEAAQRYERLAAEWRASVSVVRPIGEVSRVAQDMDLMASPLRMWGRQADIDAGNASFGSPETEEKAELVRLRSENQVLWMERDFIKKPRHAQGMSATRSRCGRAGLAGRQKGQSAR